MAKPRRKILLIDDNRADRRLLRIRLEDAGEYEVWEEERGQAGLARCREIQPDCVVLDYHLPDLDGVEFLRQLRQGGAPVECAVVMLTGEGNEAVAVEAMKNGAQDYLVKRIGSDEGLTHSIERAVEKALLEQTVAAQRHVLEERNRALEDALTQLRRARDELERRVFERTSELRTANEALRTEVEARRQAEEDLRLYGEVLYGMVEGVVITTAGGVIAYTNPAFEGLFGYTADELRGQPLEVLSTADESAPAPNVAALTSSLYVAGGWQGEVHSRRKDGLVLVTYARVTTVRWAGATYVISVHEDLTARRQIEAQLRERERLAHIGSTAGRLTHEIGNRLNGISTCIQLLDRGLAKRPAPGDVLLGEVTRDLRSETDRLVTLLRDLRTLARPYRLDLRPTDLAELVAEVVGTQHRLCVERGVRVEGALPPALPPVLADREKLTQVLHSLCENALDAMPHGGTLTIDGAAADGQVRLTVRDTGAGIPTQVDVFEPFVTTKAGGSGLGLTVARQLVDAHHGTLTYTTIPGQGTAFTVGLPVAAP